MIARWIYYFKWKRTVFMAFDGLYLAACIAEFQERILGGKISKIIQSEKDELQLFIKKEKSTEILHLSANPLLPSSIFGK